MRTETKTMLLGDCQNLNITEPVVVSYKGRYLRRSGSWHNTEITLQEADTMLISQVETWSPDCKIHFFTEKTPEEIRQQFQAMTPNEKLSLTLFNCSDIRKVNADHYVSESIIMLDFRSLMTKRLEYEKLNDQVIAYLLVCDTVARSVMTPEQKSMLSSLVAECKYKLITSSRPSPGSQRVIGAFNHFMEM